MKPVPPELVRAGAVAIEFQPAWLSDEGLHRQRKVLPAGLTLAEYVAAFAPPAEIETHGRAYLHDARGVPHIIDADRWHRVRLKPGALVYATCVPQDGGGGGDSGKQAFQIVGAIALIALTAWVGGGGLQMLAPSLFGAAFASGQIGAVTAAAALAVGGQYALSRINKPSGAGGVAAPVTAGISGAGGSSPGIAGITQNSARPYAQLCTAAGLIRFSPDVVARPFTTNEDNEQVVHAIFGGAGPLDFADADILINKSLLADLPAGAVEVETRKGLDSDTPLSLVTQCGFEENVNLEASRHRLDTDNRTLIEPFASSYPRASIFRSAKDTDRFRITLLFGGGLQFYNSNGKVLKSFRIEVRKVGTGTWRKLPELHLEACVRSAFRQEIWLEFATADRASAFASEVAGQNSFWARAYFRAKTTAPLTEWEADSYFAVGGSADTNANVSHVYFGRNKAIVHLTPDQFPVGEYDVRIVAGFPDAAGANFTDAAYLGGLFTYRSVSGDKKQLPNQSDVVGQVAFESHTSFRDQYPLRRRNLFLIALKARNLRIESVSVKAAPIVPVWNGSAWTDGAPVASSNPAALVRYIRTGRYASHKVDPAKMDGMSDWYDHCVSKGLACGYALTEGSIDDITDLVAQTGDAVIRRSNRFGVVIDRDRSAEVPKALFGPHNMSEPLTITKKFLRAARAIAPSFNDATDDYAVKELPPIYDEGVAPGQTLIDAQHIEGLNTEALVRRAIVRMMRRARLRSIAYAWGSHVSHLNCAKGDKVLLQHDVLVNCFVTGRVRHVGKEGSYVRSVTLNNMMPELPWASATGLFEVPDLFEVSDLFTLAGPKIGLQIELTDNTFLTLPILSVDGATLTVEGDVTCPATLKKTCLAAAGPRARETRSVILADLTHRSRFHARLSAFDTADAIHEGY